MKFLFSLILGCLVLLCGAASCRSSRDAYFVPAGVTGWFVVVFNQQGWPPLEADKEGGIYRFNGDRILMTSSKLNEDHHRAEYYFTDVAGNQIRATTSPIGGGGQIWGRQTSSRREVGKADLLIYSFFVGPETVFKQSSENELEAQIELIRTKLQQRNKSP